MTGKFLYKDIFARNRLLWGEKAQDSLGQSKVILAGLGGVGSYAAEALVRGGIGALVLIDNDRVEVSNFNRQLPATLSNVGRPKAQVVGERLAAINPYCRLEIMEVFVCPDNVAMLGQADYFVDAIDYMPGKVAIITHALAQGKPVASAMGAGLRLAPECLRLADISQSRGCPLARELRRRLRANGIERGVTVVYSEEPPRKNALPEEGPELAERGAKRPLGSSPFVPSAAGLLLASAVLRDLAGIER
ncbi:MAG: tRNA threonylcarbamoyladenosine dehydratase [Clostridiales bacterium]|nr:tRNA threonylcarbamoyladenosine dehydratase [Clostridiales bacterium]